MHQLLTEENTKFIQEHIKDDVKQLALKTHGKDLPMGFLLTQIDCHQRATKKLPSWSQNFNLVFPNKLALEQCSSEQTANYKASLFSGTRLLDMTGGLGIDSLAFAKTFSKVTYCDLKKENCEAAKENFYTLGAANIEALNKDSTELLSHSYDLILVDPARRDDYNRKVFRFEDCLPNVVSLTNEIFNASSNVLIKASPMIDLELGLKELKYVKTIHVIGINNDCKEILFHLEEGFNQEPKVVVQDLAIDSKPLVFKWSERHTTIPISPVLKFIHLPHTAINKARGYAALGKRHDLSIIGAGTNILTSNAPIKEFSGRSLEVINIKDFNSKDIKNMGLKKANVITRNFDQSIEDIRKRFKLLDGGQDYLIFCKVNSDRKVIHCYLR